MQPADADRRITALFDAHYDEVLAYCARRIGRTDADDAATDVFAVAWRRIDEIEWETVRPWLYGIARGVLANRSRSARRRTRLVGRLAGLSPGSPETPESYVVRRDADNEVVAAIREMKPTDQEVLMLAAWEELTAPEIATALDVSTAAAEQRLHRAKKRLAKALKPATTAHQFSARAAQEEGGR
jgi:RNA polymerase sigma-70 factor (ECF subfamily)